MTFELYVVLRQGSGMDLFRQVLGGGDRDDGDDDGMEEEALLLYGADSSSSSSQENERVEEDSNGPSQFDVSLPARHLYLGQMEEEGQAAMEDEETTPTLPLLYLPERVLFPGETLPMHIYNPHAIQMLRDSVTRHKPVAILTDLRENAELHVNRPTQDELSHVGTTAEVVALREEDDDMEVQWGPCMVVKFLGRQRFRLLETIRRANGQMAGRVVILPEQLLPPRPLHLFACPPNIYTGYVANRHAARTEGTAGKQAEKYDQLLQRPLLSSSLCHTPHWVFTLYDTEYLRSKIVREQMMMAPEGLTSSRLPEDTVSLSYWLSRRLPISDREKLHLLSLHCPTLRLIRGLMILENLTDLCCVTCGKIITKKVNLFSMSVDGPVASYVNPGGYVHDTLTAKKAENYRTHGPSSTEHSWFPGYSWTILECSGCNTHKGWLFRATRRGLYPTQFFGLRRQCLQHKPSKEGEGDEGGGRGRRPHPCTTS